MFEQPVGKEEKDRSRSIMLLSALAVLVVIGIIVLLNSYPKKPVTIELQHAGSPDFDAYSPLVIFDDLDLRTGERVTGRFGRLLCWVRNGGDRVIEGLQIRAWAVGFDSEVIKEKVVTVVPTDFHETLAPESRLRLDIHLDQIPPPSMIQDMKLEVYGLKVKPSPDQAR
jgi:hypothetical protein